ncbi:hypothetical protein SAMN04487772_10886 [[Clostridium] polysaccharolyticum]|uniref:Uncharacterized protein n=2 Tax=[Clostridium] polysaccharolyticum TaxID=29364 RepID=A0A1I0BTE7_9FIRM|nr:hypothetical protein SAMN04487772_10886 [[Clostridium] polysaccharolyticum]
MIDGIQKLFSKKGKVKQFGYKREYGDVEQVEPEDLFMDEEYTNHYEYEDEYFD